MLATMVEAAILTLVGVLLVLKGRGVIGKEPEDFLEAQKQEKARRGMYMAGLVLIALAVFRTIQVLWLR